MNIFDEGTFGMSPSVPHYYGDMVRTLLIAAAVIMLVGAPFYSESLSDNLQIIVIGVIVTVAFAALTNPRKYWVVVGDAFISGIGLAVYSLSTLQGYNTEALIPFVLRGTIAVLFLFAFYFSLKTVRAMMLHQVGHHEGAEEFEEKREKSEQ